MAHPESLDAAGFDPEVLAQHAEFVRRLARGLVRDGDGAEELTARTLAAAVERRPDTGPGFPAWLRRVTWRLFVRDRREQERRDRRERVAASPEPTRPTVDLVAELDLQRRLARAFEELAEPSKGALYLRYFRDLGPAEIAAQLGVPVATVKSRLQRGLEALRARMDAAHGGKRDAWLQALIPWIGGPAVVATKVKAVPIAAAALLLIGLGVGGVEWMRREGAPREAAPRATPALASAESATAAERAAAPTSDATPTRAPDVATGKLPFASGIVVDEAGAPLANVAVVASRLNRQEIGGDRLSQDPLRLDRFERDRLAATDAKGRFEVGEPGVDVVALAFLRDDFATEEWSDLAADRARNQDHRVVLHAGVALRGRVVDHEHQPIELALVHMIPLFGTNDSAGERTAANLADMPTYRSAAGQQWTTSDAKGAFSFGSPPAAKFRLSLLAAGFAWTQIPSDALPDPRELVLTRNSLLVDVTDSDSGAPLRAALVVTDRKGTVLEQSSPWLPKDPDHSVLAPRGRLMVHIGFGETFRKAEVTWVAEAGEGGASISLHVMAAGHVGKVVDVTIKKDAEPPHLQVALEPDDGAASEPAIEGRVVGAKHAEVRAFCLIPNWSETYLEAGEPLLAVRCDDDGHFELFDLPAARYRLSVRADGFAPAFVDVDAPTRDVTIEMRAAAKLEVAVKNHAGATVAGAVVHVQRPDGSRAWYAKTAADGVATFERLGAGALLIGAFEDMRYDLVDPTVCFPLTRTAFTDATVVELKAGESVHVERTVVERLATRLRFTRDDGRPVEQVKLELHNFDGPVTARYHELDRVRSVVRAPELDANGEVTLDLDPGHYELSVNDGGPSAFMKLDIPSRDGGPITIVVPTLRERGTITGRVVDSVTGRPIAKRKVYAMPHSEGGRQLEPVLQLTDDDGRFRFERSPVGATRVAVYAGQIGDESRFVEDDPASPYGTGSQECIVELGGEVALEIALPPLRAKDASFPTLALDARVSDAASGLPLEKATLFVGARVGATDVEIAQATTDADGRAQLRVFAAEKYSVSIYGPYTPRGKEGPSWASQTLECTPVNGVLTVTGALAKPH